MIQTESMLDVADNSGAKRVHVHQGTRRFSPSLRSASAMSSKLLLRKLFLAVR